MNRRSFVSRLVGGVAGILAVPKMALRQTPERPRLQHDELRRYADQMAAHEYFKASADEMIRITPKAPFNAQ